MPSRNDKEVLRALGAEYADIAALPVQEEKRGLWRALNARKPERPMVMIDQIPWQEMNVDDELTLRCEDEFCRALEEQMRRVIYQWKHFPVDMVVEPYIPVQKVVENTGFGIDVHDETVGTDEDNPVVAHQYLNQFESDDALENMHMPRVTYNAAETERRLDIAHDVFDGIIDVRPVGSTLNPSIWDRVAQWMGVQNIMYALIDRPEFMHALAQRVLDGLMTTFDQLEEQGLLESPQPLIHCTGAYTDDLPSPGYDPEKPRTQDVWMMGLAQIFSTISPAMFKEFEIDYTAKLCARHGLVYYGCCEPLDGYMNEVRLLPNVRKISMSPWVNQERGAEEIAGDYVFSRKPNPAHVATESFHEETVRDDLQETVDTCAPHGCPLELILKDISTVRYEPQRLWKWGDIAMKLVTRT